MHCPFPVFYFVFLGVGFGVPSFAHNDHLAQSIGNISFKYYPAVSFTFTNSNQGVASVASIGSEIADAKLILPFCVGSGTNLGCGALSANGQNVMVSAFVSMTTTLSVNLLAVFVST